MADYALEQIRGYMHKRWTKNGEAPGSNGAKVCTHAIAKVLLKDKGSKGPFLSASRLHNAGH